MLKYNFLVTRKCIKKVLFHLCLQTELCTSNKTLSLPVLMCIHIQNLPGLYFSDVKVYITIYTTQKFDCCL